MRHLKLTFVGLLALTAAASTAFAQGPAGPSSGDVTVERGTSNSGANVTVLRGAPDYGSGADYRGSGASAAGTEAEAAAASECNQSAMQICRQNWDYCSDICVTGGAQSQQTCWTGCVTRYNHCRIASGCR
jgi:hypothetical protein